MKKNLAYEYEILCSRSHKFLQYNLLKYLTMLLIVMFSVFNAKAQDEDVMFQAFDWNVHQQPAGQTWYGVLDQVKQDIADAGIDMIWMPPPSNSAAPQGYLPRELYDLNTAYGSQQQLIDLIASFHSLDMRVISDIVINHRVGSSDAVTFDNPAWPTFYITADDEGPQFVNRPVELSINGDYFPGFALKADGSNGGFAAARDLDHFNPAVRQEIIRWMNFLRNDIGFDGWRYDFVHGYDPIFNKEYNDATNPYFAVGELLESSRVQTNNWVNFTQQSSSAFDFNTKVALQNAIRANNFSFLRDFDGNSSGMIGINPAKSVTFLDNHDTGLAQQCCGSDFVFPSDESSLRKGYAYILTHPGNPMVFWTHFFDGGQSVRNAISDLIAIRKDVRIYAGTTMNIVESRNDLYAAFIDGRNGTIAMKLGPGNWSPGNGWVLRTSGTDYAVWTQGGSNNNGGGSNETAEPYTVNFRKPANWGPNTFVYLFNNATNSVLGGTQAFPGQQMTNLDGSEWYAYNVTPPAGVAAENISLLFTDNQGNQTDDLNRGTDGWYTNGAWSQDCPVACPGTNGGGNSQTVDPFTVNFRKPTNWGPNTFVYFFNNATNTLLSGTQNFPGQQMTNLSGSEWYAYNVTPPAGVAAENISLLFTDNQGNQTDDLMRGTDGWYTNGSWTQNCPIACPGSGGANNSNTFTVRFRRPNNWSTAVNAYFFSTASNSVLGGTANFPGQSMTRLNNRWYEYEVTVPSGESSQNVAMVFSDGSGRQSNDIQRGSDGWYTNGTWTTSCPVGCQGISQGREDLGLEEEFEENFTFSVFPNPAEDQVSLKMYIENPTEITVQIISLSGKAMISENFNQPIQGNYQVDLPTSNLESGLYILLVDLDGHTSKQKLFIK